MTPVEMNDTFDVLFNNITSNQAPGLDAYEKSLFLTMAQDELVKSYFNPYYNKTGEGYDANERRQIDFSMITVVAKSQVLVNGMIVRPDTMDDLKVDNPLFDMRENTKAVALPDDILMTINETVVVDRIMEKSSKDSPRFPIKEVTLLVLPITYTEYNTLMTAPYKRPSLYLAWRLTNSSTAAFNDIIIGSGDTFKQYIIRYIRKPNPIVLDTLVEVSIDGEQNVSECELDPEMHLDIVKRAVELAKAAYTGTLQDMATIGLLSSTEKGIVPKLQN